MVLGAVAAAAVLEHHGVKGQRWGIRKDKSGGGKPEKLSKLTNQHGERLTKSDAKWVKSAGNYNKGLKAYNRAAHEMNEHHVDRINNKPAYKKAADNGNLEKDTPIARKYEKEFQDTFTSVFDKHIKAEFGDSPSGKYTIKPDPDGSPSWSIEFNDIQHADLMTITVTFVRNAQGAITSFKQSSGDAMTQGALAVGDILEHHGVKGMHWGQRKNRATVQTSKKPVSAKTKPVVVSADAKRAAAVKAKAARGGAKALSNKDLKDLNERLNLEQNYSRLTKGDKGLSGKGAKKAGEILGQIGQQQAREVGNKIVAKQIGKVLAKGAFAVLI